MTEEQALLTQLIAKGINAKYQLNKEVLCRVTPDKWRALLTLSEKHKVTSFLYDAVVKPLEESKSPSSNVPEDVLKEIKKKALTTCRQDFNLLFMSKKILDSFAEVNINAALLKGMATASYFDNPLSRKSGDIDILIFDKNDIGKAAEIMEKLGFKADGNQPVLHHVVFGNEEGMDVELHTMTAEPFDRAAVNKKIEEDTEKMSGRVIARECLGIKLPMLDEASHAYELLLHMLQHYLRSGFGVRLLCDWVVFWNAVMNLDYKGIIDEYSGYVTGIGIRRFSDMITLVCRRFLGLDEKIADMLICEDAAEIFSDEDLNAYMNEFMKAEEFGKTSAERMVAPRGSGLRALFIEFDHQTALNFPKAYRVFIIRPVLWIRTYIRFVRNNKKIRNVSTSEVIKNARERGRLNEKLQFFA